METKGKRSKSGRKTKREKVRFKFGIDRVQENEEIKEYLRTGDQRLFETFYRRRIPTIKYLANKYKWLSEDAFSEILVVFVRTVEGYGKNGKTTDFNTFFFSSVKNNFSNVAKKKFRKKRTTSEGHDPAYHTVSLDSCIDGNNDSPLFHELITSSYDERYEDDAMIECVDRICDGNKFLSEVLLSFLDLTKRQIVRRKHIFKCSFPLITGDVYLDIRQGIGIPDDLFEIEESKVCGAMITCKIRMKIRKLLDFFAKKTVEKGIVSQVTEG